MSDEPSIGQERSVDKVINKASEPVQYLDADENRKLEDGTALCLSGGGYRAMLFHTGVLWRLNEIGWLPKLNRISSVSGGSITAGVLALNWIDCLYDTRPKASLLESSCFYIN